MTNTYQSLEEVAVDYLSSMQDADDSLFTAGDKLIAARDQGYGLRAIWQACGGARRVSRATVNNHMRTALIFPPDKRAADVNWTLHYTCAKQALMKDPSTWAKAHEWLDKVVELNMGKAQLEEAIAADNGNPKKGEPVYLLRNVEGVIHDFNWHWPAEGQKASFTFITVKIEGDIEWPVGFERVRVTILQPAPEVQQLDEEAA